MSYCSSTNIALCYFANTKVVGANPREHMKLVTLPSSNLLWISAQINVETGGKNPFVLVKIALGGCFTKQDFSVSWIS